MEFPNTYNINTKLSYGRSPIKIQSLCEDFDGLKRITEDSPLLESNEFEVDSGKNWYDLIQFADSFHFAISERIKKLLEENAITGWNSFPIIIKNFPDKKYHTFFVNAIIGELKNLEQLNSYETEIHEFDRSSWQGTDFFSHSNTLSIICTEKVKKILKKNKTTNLEIEQYQIKNLK